MAAAVASCFAGNPAFANPTGPAVAHGQAGFSTQGNTLTVTNTPGTVINWQGFSIAGNEIARFIQQSQSSSVLNRVVGVNPSAILGALQSNGRVFLVNPNGITIGPGANIDVAGFVASTLNITDGDFIAGRMRFAPTTGAGSVVNQGTINTASGGVVYLVGTDVQNSGIIRSPQGEILLAAGKSVELVDSQAPEIRVQVTAPGNQALNLGQLIAAGGRIGMYGTLVRQSGVVNANTAVMGENGKIVFKAVRDVSLSAGSITTASGTATGVGGGAVHIEGERVVNAGTIATNAGNHAISGSITATAQRELVLEATSRVEARGAEHGSGGGRVFMYSHGDATALPGQVIDISGGLSTGHGGSGEFSAANFVSFGGTVRGTAAPGYNKGSFLIDPLNFSFAGGTISANTVIQAEDNISIDGNATIDPGFTLTLLADHSDNGGSPLAGVWDTGGGGGAVGVGSITRSGNFTISGGAGSNLGMYAAGGGIGIGGSGAIQTDLNGGSLSVVINPASVGSANVAVTQTTTSTLDVAGISAAGRDVTLTSSGAISQTGAISAGLLDTSSVGGTVLNGANAVGSFTASNTGLGNIELTNTMGTLDITGVTQNTGDVLIGNTGAIVVSGTTLTGGDLNLTSTTGISQTGAMNIAGQSVFDGGAGSIDLMNVSNDFQGLVTLNATGSAIAIRDANTLALGVPALHGANTAITAIAGTTLTLPAYDYSTGSGAIDFQSNGGQLLTNGTLTTAGGGISLTGSGGITLSHNLTTTGGDIALLSPAVLGTSVSLSSGGGNMDALSITGSTAGGQNLILAAGSGNITVAGDLGVTRLGTLSVNSGGVVQFLGSGMQQLAALAVSQSGATTFSGPVNVTGGVSLAATAGDAAFLGGLTTGLASSFATTGVFQIGDASADTSSIAGGLTRNAGLPSMLAGDITVTGPVTLAETTVPAGQLAVLQAGSNPVMFTSTVDGPGGLTVNSAGITTFSGMVGGIVPLSGIVTDATGSTLISGGLVSTDGVAGQVYNDPVSIGAGPANTVFLSNGADVTFNQTLTGNGADMTFGAVLSPLGNLQVVGALTNVDDFDVFATSASVNSGSNNSINRVAFDTSGNVSHFDQGGILLDTSSVGGTLNLTANTGNITQTGQVTVGGAAAITSNRGSIVTGGAGTGFSAASATFIANDGLGNDSGTLAVGAGGITTTAPGGSIVLMAADGVTVGGSVVSNNGNITIASGNTPGMASLGLPLAANAGGAALGSVAINAPVRAGSGNITIYASGPVSQLTGAGTDAGLQTLNALTVRTYNDTAGAATITLDNDNDAADSTAPVTPSGCTGIAAGHGAGNCAFQITLETRQAGDTGVASTTAFPGGFAASQISYKSISGTQIIGIGTASDVLLEADSWTLGAGAINGRNVNIVATGVSGGGTIDVGILIPTTYINNNQTGGSLNLIAARDINVSPAGAIGASSARFDHDLVLAAGNDINLQGSIYLAGDLNLRANALAADLLGHAPLGVTGNVNMSNPGSAPLEVRAANITLGTPSRPVNNFSISAGTATTGQQRDAILEADDRLDINLAGNLLMVAGTATASTPSGAGTTADAVIRSNDTRAVIGGNIAMTGGSATIASTAGSDQSADASAIFAGGAFALEVGGNVSLAAGTADAATGGNTATANAQIAAQAGFAPVIQGDLNLIGGTATAQPVSGEIANAVAAALLESDSNMLLKVVGNVVLQGGTATALNTGGGSFAEADAGAFVNSKSVVNLAVDQNFVIAGGNAVATGNNLRAIASAGVQTGNLASGESLLINTLGNMNLTGGTASGAAADAAALVYSAAEAKIGVSGPLGLRIEGGIGPFFPPYSSGVFSPDSDFFHLIGDTSLVRIQGNAYPITVTGAITIVPNQALGPALLISEAPPLNLDSLQAAFIKSTDCVSFSGGSCTLSEATSANAGKGTKGATGGVCK